MSPGLCAAIASRSSSIEEIGSPSSGDDDVSSEVVGLARDDDPRLAGLEPRLGGAARGAHVLDEHSRVDGKVVGLCEIGRDRLPGDAEVRVLDPAGLQDLRDDILDGVRGNGEADADVAARADTTRLDLGVDADHLSAAVEQRSARVAPVDGSIGLDDVVDGEVVGRRDQPLECAHDAGGRGAVETERIADGHDRVTDSHLGRSRLAGAA